MTYFRYARGWKSGGLRATQLTVVEFSNRPAEFIEPYRPEEVDSYEVGIKTSWLDNQLFFNVALFWNDYKDLQVTSLEADDRGIVSALINNAEKSVTRGFEIETSYAPDWADVIPLPDSSLIFTAGMGFTDAFFEVFTGRAQPPVVPGIRTTCPNGLIRAQSPACDSAIDQFVSQTVLSALGLGPGFSPVPVDNSANRFKNTPRVNVNASATYAFEPATDMELIFRLDYAYRSTVYYTTINDFDLADGQLHLLNASITFTLQHLGIKAFEGALSETSFAFWVKNLTDETYVTGALSLGDALGADASYFSKPRTFGGRIIQRF